MTAYDFEQLPADQQTHLWSRWTAEAKARILRTASPESTARQLATTDGWDGLTPPPHPDGLDWDSDRLTWVYPPPPPEPPPVPATLRPRQLWHALLQRGITRDMVDAIIATLPAAQQEVAKIEMTGHVYERLNPWISTLGAALGLTESDIDDVFIVGAEL